MHRKNDVISVKVSFSQKREAFGCFPRKNRFEMNHSLDARVRIPRIFIWIDEIELEKLNENSKRTNNPSHVFILR